jgi:lysozyme
MTDTANFLGMQHGVVSVALLDRIMRHEGYRRHGYRCPAGALTVGYGRNLDSIGVSEEEAIMLLENDMARTALELDAALPWWRLLPEEPRGVLHEMAFNMGVPKLMGFAKALDAARRQDWAVAAREMLSSKWAEQVGVRAITLANIMREG